MSPWTPVFRAEHAVVVYLVPEKRSDKVTLQGFLQGARPDDRDSVREVMGNYSGESPSISRVVGRCEELLTSLGRDLNPGSRPYQDVDTFRGLKTPFCPYSDNTFSACFSDHVAVLEFPVLSGVGRSLRQLSIILQPLETPGKQSFGLTHNASYTPKKLQKIEI